MQINNPENCAFFLDLDGTLIDIASAPDRVVVPQCLVMVLRRLSRALRGALAIVSGRPISEIDRFLAPLKPIVAGVHGAELRTVPDGQIQTVAEPLEPALVAAVQQLAALHPGVVVEVKSSSIAVHYRMAPAAEPRIEAALQRILDNGPSHLILCQGRSVLEIVPTRVSKGAALEALLELPQFRGRRPIMIGDDISDQTAFEAAVRLGGLGFRVAGEHFPQDAAQFDSPAHVRTWLSGVAEALDA